ncbi:hypothetical protein MUP05_06625, partial [Candidatus Bathyarchaeota archaeon]|nr:hypothetical protein [Candidatus Bathyarchaeota archaeon]
MTKKQTGQMRSNTPTTAPELADALNYADTHQKSFLAELLELLRIPSIGTQPEHRRDTSAAADWL